ncbi:MAG: hypothetical protein EXX96DRAFT_649456 [Benjaminiella poitrasii]|nr:MAG: hypothetical protein EXX96DRAFT_649456 [Benjaminiella poitrasii]
MSYIDMDRMAYSSSTSSSINSSPPHYYSAIMANNLDHSPEFNHVNPLTNYNLSSQKPPILMVENDHSIHKYYSTHPTATTNVNTSAMYYYGLEKPSTTTSRENILLSPIPDPFYDVYPGDMPLLLTPPVSGINLQQHPSRASIDYCCCEPGSMSLPPPPSVNAACMDPFCNSCVESPMPTAVMMSTPSLPTSPCYSPGCQCHLVPLPSPSQQSTTLNYDPHPVLSTQQSSKRTTSKRAPYSKSQGRRNQDSTQNSSNNNTPRRYKCTLCTKRFTRPSSLATHMHSHTGEKPYKCVVEGCGRRFSVVSNLRRHAKIHSPNTL